MKIGEVFKKEITRPIKGVITVGGSEDTSELKQELEEYVVRKLISKNITKISLSELYNICRGKIQRAQDLNEVLVSLEQKGYLVSVTEKNKYNKNIKMIVCNPDIETAQI